MAKITKNLNIFIDENQNEEEVVNKIYNFFKEQNISFEEVTTKSLTIVEDVKKEKLSKIIGKIKSPTDENNKENLGEKNAK
jgi:GTP-binding protein EngB required for normal cell division